MFHLKNEIYLHIKKQLKRNQNKNKRSSTFLNGPRVLIRINIIQKLNYMIYIKKIRINNIQIA